jgi:hypothetical protein
VTVQLVTLELLVSNVRLDSIVLLVVVSWDNAPAATAMAIPEIVMPLASVWHASTTLKDHSVTDADVVSMAMPGLVLHRTVSHVHVH